MVFAKIKIESLLSIAGFFSSKSLQSLSDRFLLKRTTPPRAFEPFESDILLQFPLLSPMLMLILLLLLLLMLLLLLLMLLLLLLLMLLLMLLLVMLLLLMLLLVI